MKTKLNKWQSIIRNFKLSFINLWRNKVLSMASVAVIAILLFIFNIILSINFTVQNTLNDLGKKVDLVVYLKDFQEGELAISNVIEQIKQIKGIEAVNYSSKDDALKTIASLHPETAEFLKKYQIENPLPASLSITTDTPSIQEDIKKQIQQKFPNLISTISSAQSDQNDKTARIISSLNTVQGFADQIVFWLILTFIIGGGLVIVNSLHITIFARRKELFIMRFIGASHSFIRLPYMLEAIWYATLAVFISFGMLLIFNLSTHSSETLTLLNASLLDTGKIFLLELVATITLSIISSLIAVEKHLRSKLI